MLISGGTVLGPQYIPIRIPSEASGRKCVRLSATGQYIQFTNQADATALVVRYCVPDTADGAGADYTLSLYTNGVLAARLPVTSKYSWLYGNYPFANNPSAGSARNFFDEVHTNGLILNAGTVIRLQKDAADTASYYVIDLVDTENVPAGHFAAGQFPFRDELWRSRRWSHGLHRFFPELYQRRKFAEQIRLDSLRRLFDHRHAQSVLQHPNQRRGHVVFQIGRQPFALHHCIAASESERLRAAISNCPISPSSAA